VATTSAIRAGVAEVFASFRLRDFARVDGFFLPALTPGGRDRLVFSDINIISGMEQTSFLFQQARKQTLNP
jgi:D-alanine-D-alanine ligase-like ATP-grasp enzyme